MKRTFGWLIAAALLGASALHAQQPQSPQQPPVPDPALQAEPVTDQDLETFADIYIELEDTLSRFEEELASVETDQEAQDLQVRMQEESFAKIEEHGWTLTDYNRVVQALNADPNLLQKAVALIEDRRS